MSFWSDLINALTGRKPRKPPTPGPTPTPPKPPFGIRRINSSVSPDNTKLVYATDTLNEYSADRALPGENAWRRTIGIPSSETGGLSVKASADGFEPYEGRLSVNGITIDAIGGLVNLAQSVEADKVELKPIFVNLPRLSPDGAFFRKGTERFTVIECTDFRLFDKFARGESIDDVVWQRHDLGFNMHRVAGMCDVMFKFNPLEHPDFYDLLPRFSDVLARREMYFEFTPFVDAARVMPDINAQLSHWGVLEKVLARISNVACELVNENDHPSGINRIATERFTKLLGTMCSHGSNGSQSDPVRPAWDYEVFHYNDAPEWQRKTAHNPMEDGFNVTGRPAFCNESTRFPDRAASSTLAFATARGAALLTAGSCFHSVAGKNSDLWVGIERECAKAWADGARSIPLTCQLGGYVHRTDLEGPNIIRTYQRGGDDACIAAIPKD